MDTLLSILKSRTVWTIVGMAVLNGIESMRDTMSPEVIKIIDAVLLVAGIWFRVDAKQKF